MVARCYNPSSNNFHDYGARGIRVCDRWRSFANFFADMGERPDGAMLDRIDNSGNYEPGNCRWATRVEQNRNKRSNVWLTINGETKLLKDWARESGIRHCVIRNRMKRGWPESQLLRKGLRGRPRKDDPVYANV